MKSVMLSLFFLLAILSSCNDNNVQANDGKVPPSLKKYSNKIILDWNQAAFIAMGGPEYQHSLLAANVNVMTHLAMHDALNAVVPVYETYEFTGKDKDADPIAAIASAAYEVLIGIFPDQKAYLDTQLAKSLEGVESGNRKIKGIELGKKVAQAILDLRKDDGAFLDPISTIQPSDEPGVYQQVPPLEFVFAPQWKTMKPFALERPEQFRSAPHPVLTSQAYADAFNEVKEIGRINSTARTTDQTAYAKFWYETSEIGWNRVARTVAESKNLDIVSTARLFALVNMGLADSYIAGWDSKFHHNFWRPYTAIRAAETDGNENTTADLTWEPSETTPPIHDYPSTHSALGNAAATILAAVLGDNTTFTMTSLTAQPEGSTRTFTSFMSAADENADSRVMAGIHFRFSCEAGQELGNKIGDWIVKNHLVPAKGNTP